MRQTHSKETIEHALRRLAQNNGNVICPGGHDRSRLERAAPTQERELLDRATRLRLRVDVVDPATDLGSPLAGLEPERDRRPTVNRRQRQILRKRIAVRSRAGRPFSGATQHGRGDLPSDRHGHTRTSATRREEDREKERGEREPGSHRLVQDRALHLAHELVDLEGLSTDVRRAHEARDLPTIGAATHDQDRHVVGIRSPLAPACDELRAVVIREPEVEDDGGGLTRKSRSESLAGIDRDDDIESSVGEGLGDQPANVVVVLDDKDASV
jgi:hypothetical protein